MVEQKNFTLDLIDAHFKRLNLRFFDGDKPSVLAGVSLTVTHSNLHQHGKMYVHACRTILCFFLPFLSLLFLLVCMLNSLDILLCKHSCMYTHAYTYACTNVCTHVCTQPTLHTHTYAHYTHLIVTVAMQMWTMA